MSILAKATQHIHQITTVLLLTVMLLCGFRFELAYADETKVSLNLLQSLIPTSAVNASKDNLVALPSLALTECPFSSQFTKYAAQCGRLYVQENHKVPPMASFDPLDLSGIVSIPVMIFQPQGEISGHPVVITGGGGPGSSLYIFDDFDGDPSFYYQGLEQSTLQAGRALIIMEMRGSGMSLANLDCPAITDFEIEALTNYPYVFDKDTYLALNLKCAQNKRQEGIDVNFYNTDSAIKDIDVLRELLGIKQWHLLGISHGTRISLRYAQQYPQFTASLILDSVYPFDVDAYAEISHFSHQIFSQPFLLCDLDPHCKLENSIPSITLFDEFIDKLNKQSLMITTIGESDSEGAQIDEALYESIPPFRLSPELLAYTLMMKSYDGEAILTFVQLIKDALNEDYATLNTWIVDTINLQSYMWFSEGAYASYACYEEIPFANFALAKETAKKYKLPYWDDSLLMDTDQMICDIWDVHPAQNKIKEYDLQALTLPVLTLGGELDLFTPAKWARDFQAKLPKRGDTQHLRLWPLKSHNIVYDDVCVDNIIKSFLDNPKQTLNIDCQ